MGKLTTSGKLFVPFAVGALPRRFCSDVSALDFRRVTCHITSTFFNRSIPTSALGRVICSALDFSIPLIQIAGGVCSLRLFRNPALTFGSINNHFVTHLLKCFVGGRNGGRIGILITASNSAKDTITGNFLNIRNVRICILCPGKGIDRVRRGRFAALKRGVATVRISNAFSSYRTLIGSTFVSKRLGRRLRLADTGSVGITHFLPRTFCCFCTCTRLGHTNGKSGTIVYMPDNGFNGVATNLFNGHVKLPIRHFVTSGGHGSVFFRCLRANICAPHPDVTAVTGTVSINSPDGFTHMLSLCKNDRTTVSTRVDNTACASRRVTRAVQRI